MLGIVYNYIGSQLNQRYGQRATQSNLRGMIFFLRSVWRLHTGKHRTSGEAASIFVCDTKSGASNTQLDVARSYSLISFLYH